MRSPKPHFESISPNSSFPPPAPTPTYEELCQQETSTANLWILFSNPSLLALALSSTNFLLAQCRSFLVSTLVGIPLVVYGIVRMICSLADRSPTQQDPPASEFSWYTLALVVIGTLLFVHLLSTGLFIHRHTLRQEDNLRSLQNSILQIIRTMSSLALPPDDGLKMMRYLLSIWILKTCEVSPLRYLEENSFRPLNDKFFLLTVRERDILDQAPCSCPHSAPTSVSASSSSERSGLRAQILLSWVHSYLYSPRLLTLSSPPSLSMLHTSYLTYCSSLPSLPSPSSSLLTLSVSLSQLLLHGFLVLLALFISSSLGRSRSALQEILSVSLLLLTSLLFSFLHRLISLLPSAHAGHSSFPLLSLWKETIQICRQTLSFATQRDVRSEQQWVYCDQIWTEEELEGSRPAAVVTHSFSESWEREQQQD
jgi:uncharacterized membrane protein HdeD (DUF308 family)